MTNKWLYIALSVLAVLLVMFLVLQANGVNMALNAEGLKTDDICYIEEQFTDDSGVYAVLQTYTKDGAFALVMLEKNKVGFWTVRDVNTAPNYVSMMWLKVEDSSKRTDYQMQKDGRREWHYVCCGSDAIGNIELSDDLLPDNTTVSIRQTGHEYTIHLISLNDDGFGDFSLHQSLIDNGYVPAS